MLKTCALLAALAAAVPCRAQDPASPPAADLAPAAPSAPSPATPPPAPVAEKPAVKVPLFPLWADKARAAGFELPPGCGAMINYSYQRSGIDIADLTLLTSRTSFMLATEYRWE